jgi:lipopolysaccharide export LptBFGC system permease protein LptF
LKNDFIILLLNQFNLKLQIMRRNALLFFAVALVFLAITVVFYQESGTSLAKYLIFVLNGFVAGIMFTRGILALKKE